MSIAMLSFARRLSRGLAPLAAAGSVVLALAAPAAATPVERVVSPGGIEAWLVSESAVPLIQINVAFRGGTAQDPDGLPGVATMTGALLDEGAGDLDSEAFQEALADLAVSISYDAGRDAFYGQMRTLAANRDEAFELLRLSLSEPRFDDEPVARIRRQMEARLRRDLQDPQAVISRTWSRSVFGDHPYASPAGGTLESVAAISADDLRAYHGRVLARDNLLIAVVGDIDADTLGPLLDETFAALPETADLIDVPPAELPPDGFVEVVDMEIPQTVIRFGGPGLLRDDPDFIAAFVVNHILGGGSFTSRLFREVREERGLAYSVFSHLFPMRSAGLFVGGLGTRNDRAGESLSIVRDELERMAEEGPSEEELAAAKRYLIGNYALRFDTSARIARQLVEIQLDELGIDYINIRNDLIAALSVEDVRRAAGRLVADGARYVTLVGRPEGVEAEPGGG